MASCSEPLRAARREALGAVRDLLDSLTGDLDEVDAALAAGRSIGPAERRRLAAFEAALRRAERALAAARRWCRRTRRAPRARPARS
ncbi:MAG: hypothetical protein IT376_04880 [Polyangiaceae bacterium]|nr:hypothetical protein [Polyangiaceae bacterium]